MNHDLSSSAPFEKVPATNGRVRRVCILTGGGDAPGLNAVLRAFVKTAISLDLEVYGSEDGFDGLIQSGRSLVHLHYNSVRGILPKGGSILGCSNRANPFSYPLRHGEGEELKDVSNLLHERLNAHGIDRLVLVGGDGTMHIGRRLMAMGIPVIGIPKTIDNDLAGTDLTFGFQTAVNTATWAIDTLHSTAESHDRVMVLEVMGRNAGWIAMNAGLAGGADVILIPEIPYDIERVAAKIRERAHRGATFSIVVVGEGAHALGGSLATLTAGRPGHLPRLGGAGKAVADALTNRVDHEVRVTVLGHLQRGGSPSAYDRLLGTRFGVKAAHLCHAGKRGRMVALRGQEVCDVSIEEALGEAKWVDPRGELANIARDLGVELGAAFDEYSLS